MWRLLLACLPDPDPPETDSGVVYIPQCDEDGDGYMGEEEDCDSTNPEINIGATEICDGIDNNCDGQIDETAPVWYRDRDADGFGDPLTTLAACDCPPGFVAEGGDRDDRDPTVFPGSEA